MTIGNSRVNAYSVFADGIQPEWEDEHNKNGGELCFRGAFGDDVDRIWKLCLVDLVRGGLADAVCGVRLVEKEAFSKLEVWYTADLTPADREEILRWFRQLARRQRYSIGELAHACAR